MLTHAATAVTARERLRQLLCSEGIVREAARRKFSTITANRWIGFSTAGGSL